MRPESDLDLLVDFLPGARPGLLGLSAMMREFTALLGRRVDLAVKPALQPLIPPCGTVCLSALMRGFRALLGRRVDLAVKPALKPLIRPGVLAEARLIYAA